MGLASFAVLVSQWFPPCFSLRVQGFEAVAAVVMTCMSCDMSATFELTAARLAGPAWAWGERLGPAEV